jgi:predicted ATPase/DNA-binding SARP family transcriptional activator
VNISVLGPIRAQNQDGPVDLGGARQKRLLATLVAYEGESVSIPELLDALWGDDPPPSGPRTIQSYVSRLRKSLGREAIERTAAGYRLTVPEDDVDARRFLAALEDLPHDSQMRLETIEEALSLWAGDPFEGMDHLDFASRRLTETRMALSEERAKLLAQSGRVSEAIGVLEKIISEEEFRESTWIELSRVLAQAGRPADAIRALDRYRSAIGDLGLEPSAVFLEAESELFAPDKGVSSERPIASTRSGFHGREREVERLEAMLDEHRLATVVGPGGMGKTRLTIEVSSRLERRGWLIRLERASDNSDVTPMVLAELGVETRGDPTVSLVEAMRKNPGLLILDNCEHVIDSAAKLADVMVRETPSTVVATSREPLNVPGEALLHLGPLDAESARDLFVDRARQVSPDFDADPLQIDDLCDRLDYMPLAIELAASRSRALGPGAISERLDRGYGLLDKPRRGEDSRYQTLGAMVDWSYGLLPPATRRVFERLSVFVGDFELDAASNVAGFGDVTAEDAVAHVADLVERSLLEPTAATGTYRMLRIIKSFAARQLADTGDSRETRDRHMRQYVALAGRIGQGMMGEDELQWVRLATRSAEDLGSALRWAAENGHCDAIGAILEGTFQWFYHRQPLTIMGWGDDVLEATEGHPAHAIAGAWAAQAALKRGEVGEALRIAEAATVEESPTSLFAWFIAGDLACYIGDVRAIAYFEETLRLARTVNDDVAAVDALMRLMLVNVRNQGHYEEAMSLARELSDALGTVHAPSLRSYAEFALGSALMSSDLAKAKVELQRSVEVARSVGNRFVEGMSLSELGNVLSLEGDFEEAAEILGEAVDVFKQLDNHPHTWTTLRYLAVVHAKTGSPQTAVRLEAAADESGISALSSQVVLWSDLFQGLHGLESYERLRDEGRALTLEEAVELAVA